MKGRKPIPTELKLLRGNPGRRPLPMDEPLVPEGEIVCPEYVTGIARDIFDYYVPILAGMNVLTIADVRMLAALAVTEAEFVICTKDIDENGGRLEVFNTEGSKWVSNPSVVQRSDAGKRMKALQVEFGLSPSSRTRVKAAPKPEKKSALEELRDRRKA